MIEFRQLLEMAGIAPIDVRLLRHKNDKGRSPYACWHNDRAAFDHWVCRQRADKRTEFSRPIWANFVKTPRGGTMFTGLFGASLAGPVPQDCPDMLRGGIIDQSKPYDRYDLVLMPQLSDLCGRLHIDWAAGRGWERRAENGSFPVAEIVAVNAVARPYPGHGRFLEPLSGIEALPELWRVVLTECKGIYVITCPRDRTHYIGKADGKDGFWGRWLQHAALEGDAVGFRKRAASDYTVAILEVAGSMATSGEIGEMEQLWMKKLQSRLIGIN